MIIEISDVASCKIFKFCLNVQSERGKFFANVDDINIRKKVV
jgi:hypothetical protein